MNNDCRILVVEDEEVIRRICRRILAKMGHEAVFAGGMKEASETIGSSESFDLLITDVRLPDGDGLEVISFFRDKHPRAAVLIMTGSPNPKGRAERLKEAGLAEEDVLAKPFEIKDFEKLINKKLEGKSR